MNTFLGWLCFIFGIACYSLLVIWLVKLGRVFGVVEIPHTLKTLGWEAAVFGIGLTALGTIFLFAGAALVGRRR